MYLSEKIKQKNIFSLMQYIGALLVIVSHAYPISLGDSYANPLYIVSNGQLSFGELSVNLFFFASGFFIVSSVKKAENFRKYLMDRCKRIFPSLILVMFITTYIFGTIFTTLNKLDYVTSVSTLKFFILNSFMIPCHYLPGVFENTVYTGALNGSLWTLMPQFCCYLGCYIAYKIKLLDKDKLIYTLPIFVLIWFNIELIKPISPLIYNMYHPMMFFYMGCIFNVYSNRIKMSNQLFLMTVLITLISICLNFYKPISIFVYPYILVTVAYCATLRKDVEKFFRKYFYLYYLWGFFVQRMVAYLFGGTMNVYLNIVLSILVTHILAYVSIELSKVIGKFKLSN